MRPSSVAATITIVATPRSSSVIAASRSGGHSRPISPARLPGNSASTRSPAPMPRDARAPARVGGAPRSSSGCPTYFASTPTLRKNASSNGRITASRSHAAASRFAALRPPRPELRRDVVQHRDAGAVRRLGHMQVKPGIVDENDEVVAVARELALHAAQQQVVRGNLLDDLHDAERREALHRKQHPGTRLGHARPPEGIERGVWQPFAQRAHHCRPMEIARWLARGKEDAGAGDRHAPPCTGSGVVVTASVTRRASASAARPSSPVITASRSPRTAWTKLCSSSDSASASGRVERDELDDIRELLRDPRPPPVAQAHEVAPPRGEVERQVAVGLEDPQPSHPVAGHPRRRHVGHHPALELDPRVRHVEVRREHRDARRAHVDRVGATGEVEDEVEVVDHEVEHHGHVGAARLEQRKTLALEVERMVQ